MTLLRGRVRSVITLCLLLLLLASKAQAAALADYPSFAHPVQVTHELVSAGKDENSVCITWLSSSPEPQLLLVTPAEEKDIPSHGSGLCLVQSGDCVYHDLWRFSTQVSGLTSGVEYQYCIGGMGALGHWSVRHRFRFTPAQCSSFLLLGDPQLGGSKDLERDTVRFRETLSAALQAAPEASFVCYMGDMKQTKILGERQGIKDARKEYSALKKALLATGLPAVIVCGNHDVQQQDSAFLSEFAAPVDRWQTNPEDDYAFQAGETLFMVLNSNRMDTGEHVDFLNEAIEQHPDAVWRVVLMHHSLVPNASDADREELAALKKSLTAVFSERKVDIVFSAHNHFYARSKPLDREGNPTTDGPVYICLNSSSGSILLDPWKRSTDRERRVLEVLQQQERPQFTRCSVDGTSFLVETFDTQTGETDDVVKLEKQDNQAQLKKQ